MRQGREEREGRRDESRTRREGEGGENETG
jgi:hypothetical protein